MILTKSIKWICLLLISVFVQAQEIPPIQIFTPQDYRAEDQNWSISQGLNNFIYVANNKGLLEYNGAKWTLYNSPNDGILRSVEVVEDKIYTGGYRDFGVWTKNRLGELNYHSLVKDKQFKIKEDEEFWGIIVAEDYVIFQSFERIYICNIKDGSVGVIDSDSRISKIFSIEENIYFQKNNGFYKVENGKEILLIPSKDINNQEIVGVFNRDGSLLLLTKENGFYSYRNNEVKKRKTDADEVLLNNSIYSSVKLNDESYMIGTISNGIIHLTGNGEIISTINQSDGLSNNTVLSIEEDSFGNVWLGLDNGINVLNLNSAYSVYKDKQGILGTVYSSAKTNNFLYIGTNQGLFYKSLDSHSKFKFINGTQGQVWFLNVLKGELFCGHDNGTFLIRDNRAENISNEKGTWSIKEIIGYPELLIQSNYKGLHILERSAGLKNKWRYRNKIEGFDISSRYFEFSGQYEILVSHEHKGVFRIQLDSSYTKTVKYEKLNIDSSVKSSVSIYDNSILYSSKTGVYRYNSESKTFIKDSVLSSHFSNKNYLSGKLINEKDENRLWGFSKDEIIQIEPGILNDEPIINKIPLPSELRNTKAGYENILKLDDNRYLTGTVDGYLIIDFNKIGHRPQQLYLNSAEFNSLHSTSVPLELNDTPILDNNNSNVKFNISVTNYDKLSSTKYQYRLLGLYDEWSDWSSKAEIIFENLPHGDYQFEARAMTSGLISNNVISYKFTIEKPWYLKPLAIALYVISFLLLALITQYLNSKYYRKQKQKILLKKEQELELKQLDNQRKLMEFENKNLQLDIENKNRELGTATMNLVKRNELLNNIKDELTKCKSLSEYNDVIKLINTSLNNTSDWKLFEEAFNNVDKNFMKKVKSRHPSITPNDLRLCAYLRLNLSSKEIAPLLNISHKSVEVKRYRLRKKMGLSHDQSLSNYIIEL